MTRNDVCVEIERRARFCATQLTLCYGGRMTLDSYGSQRVTESIEKAVLLLCLPSACTLLNAGVIVIDIFKVFGKLNFIHDRMTVIWVVAITLDY